MSTEFHPLTISSVERLTKDAVAVSFDVPESLKQVELDLHPDKKNGGRKFNINSKDKNIDSMFGYYSLHIPKYQFHTFELYC